jgi:hypothetical protein
VVHQDAAPDPAHRAGSRSQRTVTWVVSSEATVTMDLSYALYLRDNLAFHLGQASLWITMTLESL